MAGRSDGGAVYVEILQQTQLVVLGSRPALRIGSEITMCSFESVGLLVTIHTVGAQQSTQGSSVFVFFSAFRGISISYISKFEPRLRLGLGLTKLLKYTTMSRNIRATRTKYQCTSVIYIQGQIGT